MSDDELLCAICGCREEEHGGENGECTGCGAECDFEPEELDEDEE